MTTATTRGGAATVTYLRDASDSIVSMATTTGGTTTTVHYSGGPGVQFTMNSANTAVSEKTLALPGGVSVSIRPSGSTPAQVWSYPDLYGDDTVTADQTGAPGDGQYCDLRPVR